MKLLTISIAAYNVEKYLAQTLDSLVDQRYVDDLEILVINDGSKDGTGSIAQKYQDMYPQSVKYIDKDNGGHGSTINKGIEEATGKYFRIIDGDDYVDCDCFYKFIKRLKSCSTDMVINDLRAVDDEGNKRIDPGVMEHGKNPFDSLKDNVVNEISGGINTRVFGLSTVTIRTELLQKSSVKITEKCFYVDVEYIIWCIFLSRDFIYYNLPVYMYRKNPDGDNSVAKKNMIKNVGMQELVALKLCSLYEIFERNDITEEKKNVILQRIAISVGATMRTYMLFDNSSECKRNIVRFDKKICMYSDVYDKLNRDRYIKYTRIMNYSFVYIIRLLYRIYVNR